MNILHLKKNVEFQNVYKNGKSFANRCFVMYVIKNELSENRLGISVSKKVGNSVVRHRITRLVREVMRLKGQVFNSGLDIVVTARTGAVGIKYSDAEKAILHLGRLHRIVISEES
ncbi:MAG: ribonuclease P protein component [Lachnospiraceae bacterium]|nr:ribonuclease P protein component [Lachnospiraceae bacterium]MBR4145752.1 ribonuclease P protein component [Lachnospiraceae bacterium]MBR4781629.1 ribonuclease P protein component [Lachnospiraceae bacterium]